MNLSNELKAILAKYQELTVEFTEIKDEKSETIDDNKYFTMEVIYDKVEDFETNIRQHVVDNDLRVKVTYNKNIFISEITKYMDSKHNSLGVITKKVKKEMCENCKGEGIFDTIILRAYSTTKEEI